jgi:tripartite-type tricarboxylate transporter receptor subunit TctC
MFRAGMGVLFVLAATGAPAEAADAVADFYKGKRINIVVSTEAGGAYDLYARSISRHLSKHMAGNPPIIVQNMPGGGHLKASNHIFNVAEQDGTVIAATSPAVAFAPLLQVKEALFDVRKIQWLPSPTDETNMVSVWHTVPLNSFLDARERVTLMGSSGRTASPSFYGRIFNDVFKTKFKAISGYNSGPAAWLAIERGEIEGHASSTWASFKLGHADWIRDKKVKFLLQYGAKPNRDIPDVPFYANLAPSPEEKLFLEMAMAPTALGRPYWMGPGVPLERVDAIRKAFMSLFQDPAFQQDLEKQEIGLDPVSAEDVRNIVIKAYDAPQALIDRLNRLYAAEDN